MNESDCDGYCIYLNKRDILPAMEFELILESDGNKRGEKPKPTEI